MNDAGLIQRYALALALVPDPDAAGDLFMDAAAEADLRRRVTAWRHKHGFPELTADPPLPALGPDEREYALHLARRGAVRRRMRVVGRAGAAAVVAVALVVGGRFVAVPGLTAAAPAWASDAAFAEQPTSVTKDQVTLSVYKLEATPGTLTVWWSATGPGTLKYASALHPDITLWPNLSVKGNLVQNDTVRVRNEKVMGHSTYQLFMPGVTDIAVELKSIGQHQLGLELVQHAPALGRDPAAHSYPVKVEIGPNGGGIVPVQVTVGTGYTAVTYEPKVAGQSGPFAVATADNQPLKYLTTTAYQGTVDYFEAPPAGAKAVSLQPIRAFQVTTEDVDLALPGSLPSMPSVAQVEGNNLIMVIMQGVPSERNPGQTWYVPVQLGMPAVGYDEQGRSYPLNFPQRSIPVPPNALPSAPNSAYFFFEAVGLPPGAKIVRIHASEYHITPAPKVDVPLQP